MLALAHRPLLWLLARVRSEVARPAPPAMPPAAQEPLLEEAVAAIVHQLDVLAKATASLEQRLTRQEDRQSAVEAAIQQMIQIKRQQR